MEELAQEAGTCPNGLRYVSFPVAGWSVAAQEEVYGGEWRVWVLPEDYNRRLARVQFTGDEQAACEVARLIASALNHIASENARCAHVEV